VKVHVLTLFPQLFENFLEESIVGIARRGDRLDVDLVDYREFTTDRHRSVDDRPYGGGPGMVIKPEPVFAAVEAVRSRANNPDLPLLLFTPQGRTFDQSCAEWLADQPEWLGLCGRYEGFDQRIHDGFDWIELSLGPFVLSGGELAAMAVIEATTRLLPGVLGDAESARQDSFVDGRIDHPHYTRPRTFRDVDVPEVLLRGNHEEIAAWRRRQSDERTAQWKSQRKPS
jgi:tRNA (guanine37-N1)-methyltransferase